MYLQRSELERSIARLRSVSPGHTTAPQVHPSIVQLLKQMVPRYLSPFRSNLQARIGRAKTPVSRQLSRRFEQWIEFGVAITSCRISNGKAKADHLEILGVVRTSLSGDRWLLFDSRCCGTRQRSCLSWGDVLKLYAVQQ